MPKQHPEEVAELIDNLEAASNNKTAKNKRSFTCKKSTYAVATSSSGNDVLVDSWKFNDWDYKRRDLPTYARGLFTTRQRDGTPEIAVRGYDKFFNVDEVTKTRWDYIEEDTRGPYELSVKENGCIIFISGLEEDDTLLVCSKHSTGSRDDVDTSHAQAGERWVERHVTAVGKSAKDLARELRSMNVTAVGELCDDRFEEHVLAYDENSAGIYLHGINFNLPQFATLPSADVHRFADRWGFKKANFLSFDAIDEVKRFLQECEVTGTWDGRETEGFVVRCHQRRNNEDWFFKYKFEEPYLMYRQWRECTKAVIAGKVPKIKKHQKATEAYLQYARRQLIRDPNLAKLYNQNHGIIAMRNGFLAERGVKGSDIIIAEEGDDEEVTRNVIVVTIASLGCGKTTVALGLAHLFGWAHVQNDNIPKQKNKPRKFALDVTNALAVKPVVIADRNNHQRRERQQIMDDALPAVHGGARYVALHWVHEPKSQLLPDIRQVTRQRIFDRGDNHQTIRAKSTDNIIGIMEGFLKRFEGVDRTREPDSEFDEIIDMDVKASSRDNLEKAAAQLHAKYPQIVKRMPTVRELDEAIDSAVNNYQVQIDLSHQYSSKNKQPKPMDANALANKIEYFNISVPATEVTSLLDTLFQAVTPEKARLYKHLVTMRRIQPTFHVTLIHRAMKQSRPEIWDYYVGRYVQAMKQEQQQDTPTTLGTARVRLERLVWDMSIMAFVVGIMPTAEEESWMCANAVPHITVGTAAQEIKPKESNDLLQRWSHQGSDDGKTGIWEMDIPGVKVIEGVVTGVLMKGKVK